MADTLTITDNRTGKTYEVPIADGTIRAMDLRAIKAAPDDFGLMTYDPAFLNTANCRSAITYIDGDKGVLLYRGYPIEQLAEDSDYLETAYLILFGELPTATQLQHWTQQITLHTMLHENIKKFMEGFRYDAHPMGIFLSTVGALSTLNPDSKNIRVFDKTCLCTHMRNFNCWTCGSTTYRLKDTTHKLGDGNYQILSAEHVFKDYQFSVEIGRAHV